jgi:uncharacterized membrane protein
MTTRRETRGNSGATRETSSTVGRLTSGLGWFSIGLGLAEVAAPGAVAGLIGVRDNPKTRGVLRLYGLRELAAGYGILTQRNPAGWLWARVAGDAVDLSSLARTARSRNTSKTRAAIAMASVAGVTAADVYCAQRLSAATNGAKSGSAKVVRSIIINRPVEDVYRFWKDFENLPRFMEYLQSVRYIGDRRSHWIARGPAGVQIEWDAETISDQSNQIISWRAVEGSPVKHAGSVRFENAPGNRGTLVRVEIDFSSNRGAAFLGKVLKMDLGRRVTHDLRNLKQVLEVGEVIQSEASIHPGMHPAQPEPVHQY